MEETTDDLKAFFLSVFNTYYDDVEDDYSDVPLVEPNPDYKHEPAFGGRKSGHHNLPSAKPASSPRPPNPRLKLARRRRSYILRMPPKG